MGRSRVGRLLIALALMVLVVVGLVVLVGEVWLRPAAEDRIADALADELSLRERPDVTLRGFPLVLRAMQERIDSIDITVDGEVFDGLRVETVQLRVDDVEFTTSELLRGDGTLTISGGGGRAEITGIDLSRYLASVGLTATVELVDGMVRVSGPVSVGGITADASVSGELALAGDVLRFTPTSVDASAFGQVVDLSLAERVVRERFTFTTPVPQLESVQLTSVRVEDGVAVISATFGALVVTY